MRELSVAEQRYQAVLAVIADGLSVKVAAEKAEVSRQTLHSWLARYEAGGLDGLVDRSRRPRGCPHQMSAEAEEVVLELRRLHRYWGPRRLGFELSRRGLALSESAIYRCLVRAGLIEPGQRRRRAERFKRWERAAPMPVVAAGCGRWVPAGRRLHAKALTGVDDHSRFCVSARLMPAERTRRCVLDVSRAEVFGSPGGVPGGALAIVDEVVYGCDWDTRGWSSYSWSEADEAVRVPDQQRGGLRGYAASRRPLPRLSHRGGLASASDRRG